MHQALQGEDYDPFAEEEPPERLHSVEALTEIHESLLMVAYWRERAERAEETLARRKHAAFRRKEAP